MKDQKFVPDQVDPKDSPNPSDCGLLGPDLRRNVDDFVHDAFSWGAWGRLVRPRPPGVAAREPP